MKINDLQTGMLVTLENGDYAIVAKKHNSLLPIKNYGTDIKLSEYNNKNMMHEESEGLDIVEVRQPRHVMYILRDIIECAYFDHTMESFEPDTSDYILLYSTRDKIIKTRDKIIKMCNDLGIQYIDETGEYIDPVAVIAELYGKFERTGGLKNERNI